MNNGKKHITHLFGPPATERIAFINRDTGASWAYHLEQQYLACQFDIRCEQTRSWLLLYKFENEYVSCTKCIMHNCILIPLPFVYTQKCIKFGSHQQ